MIDSKRLFCHKFRQFQKQLVNLLLILVLINSFFLISVPTAKSNPSTSGYIDRLFELSSAIFELKPATTVFRRGNLEYAYVKLDGNSLFPVAVSIESSEDQPSESSLRPILQRITYIENNLRQVVALDYLPFQLLVTTESYEDEIVLFVSDPDRFPPQEIVSITQDDSKLIGQNLVDIAQSRSDIVRKALIRARAERSEEFLRSQGYKAFFIVVGILITSYSVSRVQWLLLSQMKHLLHHQPLPIWPRASSSKPEEKRNQSKYFSLNLFHKTRISRNEQSYRHKLISLAREGMRIGQIVIWGGGLVWLLKLYPYTREAGQWLLNLPVKLLAFILFVVIAKRVINFVIDSLIHSSVDRAIMLGDASRRISKRAPSISVAYKTMTQVVAIVIVTIVLLFEVLRLPTVSLVTLAGILGFLSQNLVRDYISGIAILWEDQYAVGDVITTNGFTGYVEFISLRVTQLRNLDGELISISNHLIESVQNLTNQWSRLNLGIDVAYETDLDQALSVINDVAQNLKNDSPWSNIILESPQVLGVDRFGDSGITIRLLITTQPMRQWEVGREFRLRLKKSFDQAHITIPFPQQSVWIENQGLLRSDYETNRKSSLNEK